MRYFYDLEFIEDGRTIDLISIGMVAEDGRELYAVNTHFNKVALFANPWLVEHVVPSLPMSKVYPDKPWSWGNFLEDFESGLWKSREEIKKELLEFCDPLQHGKPELWAYYGAYDHVALCQIFGKMIDLPKGWPMWTRDIKQWCADLGDPELPMIGKGEHNALHDARWVKKAWEFLNLLQAVKR